MAVWTCVGLTPVRLYKHLLPLNISLPSSCFPIPQHLSYWYPLPASDAPLFSKHSAWEICVWVPSPTAPLLYPLLSLPSFAQASWPTATWWQKGCSSLSVTPSSICLLQERECLPRGSSSSFVTLSLDWHRSHALNQWLWLENVIFWLAISGPLVPVLERGWSLSQSTGAKSWGGGPLDENQALFWESRSMMGTSNTGNSEMLLAFYFAFKKEWSKEY